MSQRSIIDRILAGEFDLDQAIAAEASAAHGQPEEPRSQYVERPKQSKVRQVGAPQQDQQEQPKAKAPQGRRGAPFKLTEHLQEIVRLYDEGVGAKVIAEKFQVSVSCVINTLRRNNVSIRPKGRRKSTI